MEHLSESAVTLVNKAEAGDFDAILEVAHSYRKGENGFPQNLELAFQWCKKGLDANTKNAALWAELARCHQDADTDVDKGAAFRAHKCAATLGHAPSMYYVAEELFYEDDESQKMECLPWLEKAASQNYGPAEALLGYIYLNGQLQTNDKKRGVNLLTRSAEHGDDQGARLLAEAYLNQVKGCEDIVSYDLSKACQYFAIAVENGEDSHKAYYYGGLGFWFGEGVSKDAMKSRKCFELLLDDEYVPSEKIFDLLGCMCFEGAGGPVDFTMGEKALKKAMTSDDKEVALHAAGNLGRYLLENTGRYDEGIELLRKAADGGDSDAQVNLGKAYYEGNGVPKNLDTAAEYFKQAAAQGNEVAADNLKVVRAESHGSVSSKETFVPASSRQRHPIRGAVIGFFVGGIISSLIGRFSPILGMTAIILGVIIGITKG